MYNIHLSYRLNVSDLDFDLSRSLKVKSDDIIELVIIIWLPIDG